MSDPMGTHEPTLGEIMRRLDDLSLAVREIPIRIDETYLRRDVHEAQMGKVTQSLDHLLDRIKKLESRSEWVVRTVGALVIAAVIGLIFAMRHLV